MMGRAAAPQGERTKSLQVSAWFLVVEVRHPESREHNQVPPIPGPAFSLRPTQRSATCPTKQTEDKHSNNCDTEADVFQGKPKEVLPPQGHCAQRVGWRATVETV